MLKKRIAVACAAVLAFLPVALTEAKSSLPKSKVVKVRDNLFNPDSLTGPAPPVTSTTCTSPAAPTA